MHFGSDESLTIRPNGRSLWLGQRQKGRKGKNDPMVLRGTRRRSGCCALWLVAVTIDHGCGCWHRSNEGNRIGDPGRRECLSEAPVHHHCHGWRCRCGAPGDCVSQLGSSPWLRHWCCTVRCSRLHRHESVRAGKRPHDAGSKQESCWRSRHGIQVRGCYRLACCRSRPDWRRCLLRLADGCRRI